MEKEKLIKKGINDMGKVNTITYENFPKQHDKYHENPTLGKSVFFVDEKDVEFDDFTEMEWVYIARWDSFLYFIFEQLLPCIISVYALVYILKSVISGNWIMSLIVFVCFLAGVVGCVVLNHFVSVKVARARMKKIRERKIKS